VVISACRQSFLAPTYYHRRDNRHSAGVDIATYHDWVYYEKELPDAAIERLTSFFAAVLNRPNADS
jgi:hypothetical protein